VCSKQENSWKGKVNSLKPFPLSRRTRQVKPPNKKTRNHLYDNSALFSLQLRSNSTPARADICAVRISLQLTHCFQIQPASISVKLNSQDQDPEHLLQLPISRTIFSTVQKLFPQVPGSVFLVLKHCRQHSNTSTKPGAHFTLFATFPVCLFAGSKANPKALVPVCAFVFKLKMPHLSRTK